MSKWTNTSLDLAIVEGPNENPSLNSILLDTDRIMAAVSPKNGLAKKEVVTLDDLRKQKDDPSR